MITERTRDYYLDALKIMSCLLVVLMHTLRNMDLDVSAWPYLYYLTRCSVPIFFMVPGAIQLNKKSIKFSYCLNKMRGIMTILVFYYGFDFLIRFTIIDKFNFCLESLKSVYYDFGAFWFLWVLIVLYLLLPIIHRLYRCKKWTLTFIMFLVCIAWALIDDYNILVLGKNDTIQKIVPQYLRLWNWIFYMCLGAILYYKIDKVRISRSWLFAAVLFTTTIAILYMFYMYHVATAVINGEYAYTSIFVMIWVGCIFVCFKAIDWSKVQKAISFCTPLLVPVYALHVIVIFQIAQFDFFAAPLMQLVAYVMVLVLSGLCGVVMQRVPFVNRLTRL